MSWTNLDDKWDVGSKLLRAAEILGSDAAHAMWVRGITHCNRENTDGRIYGAVLRTKTYHRKPQAVIDALVKVGALHSLGDDEYEFHDFLEWNDSKEEVEAKRKQKQENGRRGGKRSGESRAKQTASKDEAGASSDRSKSEAGASRALGSRFAFGSPGVNTSPLHTSPSEISDPGSLSSSSERARGRATTTAPPGGSSSDVETIQAELQRHRKLESAADRETAAMIAGIAFSAGARPEDVVGAIQACAFDLAAGSNEGAVRKALRSYVERAKSFGDAKRSGPANGAKRHEKPGYRQPGIGIYEQTNSEDV